jgi:hypothetical protein
MKKVSIVIIAIQTLLILIIYVYSLIQQTEAKKQEKLAVANAERAMQMQIMAEMQQKIATDLSVQLRNCQASSK